MAQLRAGIIRELRGFGWYDPRSEGSSTVKFCRWVLVILMAVALLADVLLIAGGLIAVVYGIIEGQATFMGGLGLAMVIFIFLLLLAPVTTILFILVGLYRRLRPADSTPVPSDQ